MTVALRSSISAGAHHPHVTQGKIVPNRILRVNRSERRCDFGGHLPPRSRVASQSKATTEPDDVRIERNDEPRRGHTCPRSEINRIAPDHPAQKQIQPLAGAARGWARKEITNPGSGRNSAICDAQIGLQGPRRERLERKANVGCRGVVARDEETLDRPRFAEHALQDQQQRHEIASTDPAMYEGIDCGSMQRRIERSDEGRWMRPHDGEERFDRLEDAGHPAERERRGAERDDLAIVWRHIAPDNVHGIGSGVDVIEGSIEVVEPRTESRPTSGTV